MGLWARLVGGSDLSKRSSEPSASDGVLPPSRDAVGRAVTEGDALAIGLVFRAAQIIATATRQLSLDPWQAGRQLVAGHALLRTPDVARTRGAFLEETAVSLALNGNAFWFVERSASGQATNVRVLPPALVTVEADGQGRVTGFSFDGKRRTPEEIAHLRLLSVPGRGRGVGPVQQAQRELRGVIDVRDYASQWFRDSGLPAGGYLSTEQNPQAEDARAVRDGWLKATRNREGIPMLTGGVKFESYVLSPADAQWLESQRFDAVTITRLFGVPGSLMFAAAEGSSLTYQNVAQEWTAFARFGLMSYLTAIEEAFTALLPRGTSARFNLEGLLRPDTSTRYAAHSVALRDGWLLPSEVRAIEGLAPVDGIDDRRPTPQIAPTPEAPRA